jgi:hypothetical protein
VDPVERRRAWRRLKAIVDSLSAGLDRARGPVEFLACVKAFNAAIGEEIQAGTPVETVKEFFERLGDVDIEEFTHDIFADLHRATVQAESAEADVSNRPAIPLPERFPDLLDEAAADVDATSVHPTVPDRRPDAAASDADVRKAEAILDVKLTQDERRIVARGLERLDNRAGRPIERAPRMRPSLCGGRSLRRARASRAPRRAAHRSAVAPARDGPPPPSDAPPPVGSRSPRGAAGGSR